MVPDLIQWHEGMLLGPQHFQQLSLRVESLIQALPDRYVPYHWGVERFEYDAVSLSTGVLSVRALAAVMPDGTAVSLSVDEPALQVDLRPHAEALRRRPMLVHLALPARDVSGPGAPARFAAFEGTPVADQNTGDGHITIPRLRPRLSLIVADSAPARYTSVPLLEMRCEGEAFMPTEFVPPTLGVAASSPLGRICTDVLVRLRNKAVLLAERVMLAPQGPGAEQAREDLRALVGSLPALEAWLHTDMAHPFTLYVALCQLAGDVAVMGHGLVPPVFPAYSHNDPRRSFETVVQFIRRSVDESVPDTVRRFAFREKGEFFSLAADAAWSHALDPASGVRLALAVRSDAGWTDEQAMAWGENAVIGGRSAIESLLARRVLGLERKHEGRVGELAGPRGVFLFELVPDAECLQPGDDLVVIGTVPGLRPPALHLYVIEREPEHTDTGHDDTKR